MIGNLHRFKALKRLAPTVLALTVVAGSGFAAAADVQSAGSAAPAPLMLDQQETAARAQMRAAFAAARADIWQELEATTRDLPTGSPGWKQAWALWVSKEMRLYRSEWNNRTQISQYFSVLRQASEREASATAQADPDGGEPWEPLVKRGLPVLEPMDAWQPVAGLASDRPGPLNCRGPGNLKFRLWQPSTWFFCDGIDWFQPFPETLAIFGHELLADLSAMGLDHQIAYLNKITAIHDGEPPLTAVEAVTTTMTMVMTDIMLAEGLQLVAGVLAAHPDLEPGVWTAVNERMSARARRYQEFLGGRGGQAYVVNGVKFDTYRNASLVEGKGFYRQFVNKRGVFYDWFSGQDGLIRQARAQVDAARGVSIEWHFNEVEAMEATRELFIRRGQAALLTRIKFVHHPMP